MTEMEPNYAERRGDILRDLDGLRVEVDAEKRIGYLILDRAPLNIVSFTGRAQIRALSRRWMRTTTSA